VTNELVTLNGRIVGCAYDDAVVILYWLTIWHNENAVERKSLQRSSKPRLSKKQQYIIFATRCQHSFQCQLTNLSSCCRKYPPVFSLEIGHVPIGHLPLWTIKSADFYVTRQILFASIIGRQKKIGGLSLV